ncbi:MAG: hypothetical protein ACKO1M_13930 [Planctomycetota bacterium]
MDVQQAEAGLDGLSFGFLTTLESPAHGLFGGYLVVDALGRPLEFHCTAPVKVSRAQQILYGPTLHGHLHGRQVGGALLAEGKATPAVVLTDNDAMLHVRPHTQLPLALVRRGAVDQAAPGFVVGDAVVSPHADDAVRAGEIEARLATLAAAVDLCEPFERIRAALDEAARH